MIKTWWERIAEIRETRTILMADRLIAMQSEIDDLREELARMEAERDAAQERAKC